MSCIRNHSELLQLTCVLCRSLVPVRLRRVHCPPGENQLWWRLHLPLSVPPLRERKSQAWITASVTRRTGLLPVQLQRADADVQFDEERSPGVRWVRSGEEGRQQDRASPLWGELVPPSWHCGGRWCQGNSCHQHLQRTGKRLLCCFISSNLRFDPTREREASLCSWSVTQAASELFHPVCKFAL